MLTRNTGGAFATSVYDLVYVTYQERVTLLIIPLVMEPMI